jgi:hypothetical protein
MNYEQKYLKYKKKYSDLKIQMEMQKGGALAFANNGSFALMLNITGDTLDRVNQRRRALGLQSLPLLHMTLLQLHINYDHPLHEIFLDRGFRDCVTQAVRNTLYQIGNPLILHSLDPATQRGRWDFLGQGNSQFWARVYIMDPTANALVRNFRREFYNCINTIITPAQLMHRLRNVRRAHGFAGAAANPTNFDIWETSPGQELYAVNTQQYLYVDRWLPHVSVLRIQELNQPSTLNLYNTLTDATHPLSRQEKNNAINARISANTVGIGQPNVQSISRLNIRENMRQLVFSVRVPAGHAQMNIDETIPL